MVCVRAVATLLILLVLLATIADAAPQRFRGRGRGGRFFGGRGRRVFQRLFRPNRFNSFFNNGGGGASNTQANANVIQATNNQGQVTSVNANVINQQQNNPNGISLSGGIALASNLQLNSPFGNINLSNANAQTINQNQQLPFFGRRRG